MKKEKTYNVNIVAVNSSWMNVSSSKSFYIEIMETWLNFVVIASIMLSIAGIKYIGQIFTAFILMLISLGAKRKINKITYFTLFNAALIVIAVCIAPNIYDKAIYGILLIFQFINDFRNKYDPKVNFFGFTRIYFDVVFFTLLLFASYGAGIYGISNIITFLGCLNILLELIYIHITRTDNLMKWETNYAKAFSNRIFKMKLAMSSIVAAVVCFMAVVMYLSGFFSLADMLQKSVLSMFNVNERYQENPKSQDISQTKGTENIDWGKLANQSSKKSPILDYLWVIVKIIIIAAVACFIIYLLWMLIINIRQNYMELNLKRKNEERESTLKTENITSRMVKNLDAVSEKIRDMLNLSNDKKIRKIYYKLVLKKRKRESIILNSDTPLEIKNKLADEENTLNTLTKMYEKARYSNSECSNEDVEKIKKLY
ncbi:hypothetical protein IAI10_17830 [Clostridium sp. 19966]|uniref:hypothetical protein n=1 Tax=Clostridium sp. 19966 TaxID=2768166 RepID=UPI0028DE6DD4|nr:hypothetical protein [Clostridium sp. 19966]MDT8718528.1 hypothetical protein [Clostridium sp. 19966]